MLKSEKHSYPFIRECETSPYAHKGAMPEPILIFPKD